jgi:hypothetical protein
MMLLLSIPETIFETVSGSGTIISWSALPHKESISKATAVICAQVRKFCFHRAIPGIKLSLLVHADGDHGFILNMYNHVISDRSRDSVVGIVTGYRLDDQGVGVRVPVGSRIFSSPSHPDWLWGPSKLPFNGYWGLFPRG